MIAMTQEGEGATEGDGMTEEGETWRPVGKTEEEEAGLGRCCSPRLPWHSEPSFRESNGSI